MKKVRLLLSGITLALLGLGYLASQAAYFFGDPADYASRIDQPGIKMLSLVLFVSAIVLAFLPEKGEPQ